MNEIPVMDVPTSIKPRVEGAIPWRHPWFIALAGASIACLFALGAVTVALLSATSSRDDLQKTLTCRSESVISLDDAMGEQAVAIGVSLSHLQNAFDALGSGDMDRFKVSLAEFPVDQQRLLDTADSVSQAVVDRQKSVFAC